MFRSPKDHPQGVRHALLKLPLYTINMYAYVGDVGACIRYKVSPCLPVHVCSLLPCLILARYKKWKNLQLYSLSDYTFCCRSITHQSSCVVYHLQVALYLYSSLTPPPPVCNISIQFHHPWFHSPNNTMRGTKWWSQSQCSFLHSFVTFSLLNPDRLLRN